MALTAEQYSLLRAIALSNWFDDVANVSFGRGHHFKFEVFRFLSVRPTGHYRQGPDDICRGTMVSSATGSTEFDQLDRPDHLAIFHNELFVIDNSNNMFNNRILSVNINLPTSEIPASCTTAVANVSSNPTGVAVDPSDGSIFVSLWTNDSVSKYSKCADGFSQQAVVVDGEFNIGNGIDQLTSPRGLCFDLDGRLIVCDAGNHRIKRVDESGHAEVIAGGREIGRNQLCFPLDVCIAPDGQIIVAECGNYRRVSMWEQGASVGRTLLDTNNVITGRTLSDPFAVCLGPRGDDILVADRSNDRILAHHAGKWVEILTGIDSPSGMVTDPKGRLYVSLSGNANRVVRFLPEWR